MKNPTHKAAHLRARQGFTLLELVVVVAVLVILAGFILPKFDVFKLKANKGVAAANMSDISRLIQTYYVQYTVYPDRMDSLLDSTGEELWAPGAPGGAAGLDPQLVGGGATPDTVTPKKLKVVPLDAGEARSLTRIGIANVFDATGTSGLPNDRFGFTDTTAGDPPVTTTNPASPRTLAENSNVAVINADDEDGEKIIKHIYARTGGELPDGKQLAVFGIGSQSTLAKLMQEVPFYPNTDVNQYYSRFLAVFEIGGGSRAELKAVLGADGDLIKEEIADYYER